MKDLISFVDLFINFKKYSENLDKILKIHDFIINNKLDTKKSENKAVKFTINNLKNIDNILEGYSKLTEISKENLKIEIECEIEKKSKIKINNYARYMHLPITSRIILIRDKLNSTAKDELKKNSVLEIILNEKIKNYYTSYKIYIFSILTSILFYKFIGIIGVYVFSLLFLMTFINQKCLEYRIFKGYYGNNPSEVAEFVKFIDSHSDKNDFNGSNGLKDIYPIISKDEKTVVYGEGVAV